MHRNLLLSNLAKYYTRNLITQEERQKYNQLKEFIATNPHCFERKNKGHITGSVWLVNHDMTQVLLTHHKKLKIWLQLGGHADGDPDIKAVALKEAQEESGIGHLEFVYDDIFDFDIHGRIP